MQIAREVLAGAALCLWRKLKIAGFGRAFLISKYVSNQTYAVDEFPVAVFSSPILRVADAILMDAISSEQL